MNAKQLLSFSRIVELGSQTRAAKTLHISESALSRQIGQLEAELGVELFVRDKVQLIPTPVGEAFCREVDRVLASFDQLPRIARELVSGERQRFRLVVIQRLAHAIAVPALVELQRMHDPLDLTIDVEPHRTMERWLRGKQYDIAIGPGSGDEAQPEGEVFATAPMVAVVPKGHRLSGRVSVGVAELAEERLALTASGSLMRRQVERLLAGAGVVNSASIDVSDTLLACQLAAEGQALTVCDPFAPAVFLSEVSLVPIEPCFMLEFLVLKPEQESSPLISDFEVILRRKTEDYLSGLFGDRTD